MRQDIKRQHGMTGLGWLMVLFLIGFFALLTFKLAPIYMEHHSVKSVLDSMQEVPHITQYTKPEILATVLKRLITNGVRDVKGNAIKITKDGGTVTIKIAYNVRKNMVGNIDVIVTFDDSVKMVAN